MAARLNQFHRQLAQPAARYTPAPAPIIRISRTGWSLGHAHQSWRTTPAAIAITGLWAITLLAAAALIMGSGI